jgi:hypothetical protein
VHRSSAELEAANAPFMMAQGESVNISDAHRLYKQPSKSIGNSTNHSAALWLNSFGMIAEM